MTRPTATRLAEIRAALAKGQWGFIEQEYPSMPDVSGRLWFGTDKSVNGMRYSALVEQSPDRMRQLVASDAAAHDLLAEVDALTAERDTLRPAVADARDLHEKAMTMLHEHAGIRRDGLAAMMAFIDESHDMRAKLAELDGKASTTDPA